VKCLVIVEEDKPIKPVSVGAQMIDRAAERRDSAGLPPRMWTFNFTWP